MDPDERWQTPQFGLYRVSHMPFSTYVGFDAVRMLPDGPATAKILRLRVTRDEELRELARPRRRMKFVTAQGDVHWITVE